MRKSSKEFYFPLILSIIKPISNKNTNKANLKSVIKGVSTGMAIVLSKASTLYSCLSSKTGFRPISNKSLLLLYLNIATMSQSSIPWAATISRAGFKTKAKNTGCEALLNCCGPVSYTHLTLPTNLSV